MVSFVKVLICIFLDTDALPLTGRLRLQLMTISSKLGALDSSNALSDLPGRITLICSPIQPFHKPVGLFSLFKFSISVWLSERNGEHTS
jgi:hypothetical protein